MTPSTPHENRIRTLRLARGWSQAELAERAGISRTGLSAIEGERLDPSVAAALSLARALDVTVEILFGTGERRETVAWAWPPRHETSRYWIAETHGRFLAYPVEPTPCGEVPHDGVSQNRAVPDVGRRDPRSTLVVAGCDPAAALLASDYMQSSRFRMIPLLRSSRPALQLLKQGLVHVAGVHLAPTAKGGGNREVVRKELGAGLKLVRLAEWEEGVAMTPGSRRRTVKSLQDAGVRWVGREPGSGARRCLDEFFGKVRPLRRLASDHRGVADAVRLGWADAGICLRLTSEEAGLDFLSLQWESYDLCYPESLEGDPRLKALLETIRDARFQRSISELPGYDTRNMGETGTA